MNRIALGAATASLALLVSACSSASPASARPSATSAAPGSTSAYAAAGALVGSATAAATPSLSTATAAATPTAARTAAPTALARAGRYAVGDSVMLGAKTRLQSRGFVVNATESRQFATAVSIIRNRKAAGTLPRQVIIHLGTNGYIALSDCKAIVSAAGTGRRVFLVNNRVPRVWQNANNRTLRACDAAFAPVRAMVVDWYGYSKGRSSWLYSDGLHLPPTGRTAYANFVDAAVDRYGL